MKEEIEKDIREEFEITKKVIKEDIKKAIAEKYPSVSQIMIDVQLLKETNQKDEAVISITFPEDSLRGCDIDSEIMGIKFYTDGSIEQKSRAYFELIRACGYYAGEEFNNSFYKHFLKIIMPCGTEKIIKTIWDFPKESVPCDCGNPNHYFVKYIER